MLKSGLALLVAPIIFAGMFSRTTLTSREMTTVARIQQEVSEKNYPYIPDTFQHIDNHDEFLSGKFGRDCDDYVAEKARRLMAEGFAMERLEYWHVRLSPKDTHAVLVIDGTVVLDNRRTRIYDDKDPTWGEVLGKWPLADLDARIWR